MSYTKAENVLPAELLRRIQQYVDGRYLYIPRREDRRKPWGTCTGSKIRTDRRNRRIFRGYMAGTSVKKLSARYFLTDKTVYKIIAGIKYKK